jgi:hypothetical protein
MMVVDAGAQLDVAASSTYTCAFTDSTCSSDLCICEKGREREGGGKLVSVLARVERERVAHTHTHTRACKHRCAFMHVCVVPVSLTFTPTYRHRHRHSPPLSLCPSLCESVWAAGARARARARTPSFFRARRRRRQVEKTWPR